ncbi:DsbA family protein [Streptomyces sp. URMC 127]|uniref:DsbA family protein n=1 Tax=Streptomyces sp. URMC 127 TaxID=3423402 RepID=UPI003F19CB19
MITVEIRSDVVCPWRYPGKRRWEKALALFPHADRIRTEWRAFELRPGFTPVEGALLSELMASHDGMTRAEIDIDEVFERLRFLGGAERIDVRPQGVRPLVREAGLTCAVTSSATSSTTSCVTSCVTSGKGTR